MTAKEIAEALHGKKSGNGWMACCPAHRDNHPSLAITQRGGKVLLYCFAGCSYEEIVTQLRQMGIFKSVRYGRNPHKKYYPEGVPKNLRKGSRGGVDI